MFSSIFGKRRASPVEDDRPPIPSAADDGFVVVNPSSPGRGMYPNLQPGSAPNLPYPARPAPPAPNITTDQNFNYLQGVPFTLSKELKMATNKDSVTADIGDLLAYMTNRKLYTHSSSYDFSVEKSVLKEY